jgi:diguanylate cyclase (GGDEF)-like protein
MTSNDAKQGASGATGLHAELVSVKAALAANEALLARAQKELEIWRAHSERELEAERERARRDALTGVLNHAAIVETLGAHLANRDGESPFAVAMVDFDGLKATNDTYGHQLGDAGLVAVVEALQVDGAVVGRYGGDEFLALLRGATRDKAEAYRDTVLSKLARSPIYHPESAVHVPISVSIGLAVYPEEAETIEDLIRLADNAMYASRRLRPVVAQGMNGVEAVSGERAAKLVAEIVPLLTSPGSREDKLRLVANHLSVGAGYDAVNFEGAVMGDDGPQEWERAFARAPSNLIDAWMSEQSQAQDHPLGLILERTRRPIFLDDAPNDPRLTETERALISAAGIRSGLIVPMIWREQIVGMLSVGSKKDAVFTSWDAQFLAAIASEVTAIVFTTKLVEELEAASEHLRQAYVETVMMLAAAAEAHDSTTGRHILRVRALSESIALELGYRDDQAAEIGLASVLHDIGKIRVPDAVLGSKSALSEAEWAIMKQHTIWGAEFLDGRLGFELATLVASAHHERWDGGGYPKGLVADEIPEAAQITSVADSFDAMTSDRPYRAGRSAEEAIAELIACSGTQFSPNVVEAMARLHERGGLPLVEREQSEDRAA